MEDAGSSVRPNVISYNAVIDAVAGGLAYGDDRHRCFDEALKVYRRMKAQYVQPTVITYTALISAAKLQVDCAAGNPFAPWEWLPLPF